MPASARSTTLRYLTIFFDVDTYDVLWFCPRCHDEGRIAGWENTFWDNSALEPENAS